MINVVFVDDDDDEETFSRLIFYSPKVKYELAFFVTANLDVEFEKVQINKTIKDHRHANGRTFIDRTLG